MTEDVLLTGTRSPMHDRIPPSDDDKRTRPVFQFDISSIIGVLGKDGGKEYHTHSRATTLGGGSISRIGRNETEPGGVFSSRLYGRCGHRPGGHIVWETCVTSRGMCHACPPSLLQLHFFRPVPGARCRSLHMSVPASSLLWNESHSSNGDTIKFLFRTGLRVCFGDGITGAKETTWDCLHQLFSRTHRVKFGGGNSGWAMGS
jgi:hypothetical protein